MSTEGCKNSAIASPRMDVSGYVRRVHAALVGCLRTIACYLVLAFGLGFK